MLLDAEFLLMSLLSAATCYSASVSSDFMALYKCCYYCYYYYYYYYNVTMCNSCLAACL